MMQSEQILDIVILFPPGELLTTARWIRNFVHNHPDYKKDSVVSDNINYDLVCRCDDITRGKVIDPTLTIEYDSKTSTNIPHAMTKAAKLLNERINTQTS